MVPSRPCSGDGIHQNSPSSFFSLAGEEAAPCTPPPTTPPTPTVTPTPSPPWFNCFWPYRKNITINKTAVSGTQTDFPVLINLSSDGDLKNHARSDGYDILFTREDGQTEIPYEREYYNNANGALAAWVKVPRLNSSTSGDAYNTTIYMYYGFLSSPDKSKPPNVWDANYKAVWHLKESGSGVADEFKDSTSNANHGTGGGGVANPTLTQSGVADGAQSFNGNDLIQKSNPAPTLEMTSQVTMEAWVYLSDSNDNQKIVGKTSHPPTGGYLLGVNTGKLYPEFWDITGTDYTFTQGSVPSTSWTHLAATWTTGGNIVGYINGNQVYSMAASSNNLNTTATSGWMRIGATPWSNPPVQFYMNGLIDEVRLSNVARDANWIATEYANQANPALFHYLGKEESFFCGGTSGPSYVQSRSLHFEYVNQASITLPGSTTAGDLLVLSCIINQSNSVSTVSDSKGNGYNIAQTTNVGTWGKLYTYNVPNSLGGPGPITATVSLQSPANKTFDVFFLEYSGVASTSPVDVSSSGSASSGTAMNSGDKPITRAPSLIYGFGAGNSSCHAAPPYTDRETANGRCAVDQTVFMTGTFNVTATQGSSGAWALQMVAFKGA